MSRRRRPRPGRHLPPHDAADLAERLDPTLHATLLADGFRLAPTVRPYLRQDGRVTVRLVWRCRAQTGDTVAITATHVVRVEGRAEP
ncbi:hypothetical protein [Roseospira goensis]|uniref:Uncharacterized protein n=1 Tax=Roseospira goensis TaxID=391922 RepID=A0A7W6S3J6_9PROT|nr:hypothetical protein [Roseospira goensis]MBB4287725.1 hypothetical protein [Roseospira goensis]